MKRTPLSKGTMIQAKGGSSYTYIIDDVIGDGASSIVYEAHYIDNVGGGHNVRLKECYPYASDIQRVGIDLVWSNADVASVDKETFTTAYHKLLDFQNTTKLRNSTAHIFDLCEANGTLYSVMDVNEGQTFEQDNSEKLSDILKTTLALARVVEKYHNNGYLHLDIKPSNFLVIPETREFVILFDVDSVTAIDDIKTGKVKCVPYSKGWAAPEQMQGQIKKLCPATDIYSIGAILFQKVMGRAVENEDIGIFADWKFDGEMFDNVNPKIKRQLRDMFRKTLAANTKRRYQSVDALISALESSVECIRDGAPYLVSDCPAPNNNFLGRGKELAQIASSFNSGNKTVFLSGFGGIGKSELAKKYAEIHIKDYDAVLFLTYEDSLEELIDNIQIQNCDTEAIKEKSKILKKLFSSQRVLLIVDNFDVEIDGDDYLDKFLRLNVDKLFTTRTDFSDLADNKTTQISIENLKSAELVSLFKKESGLIFTDGECVVIDEILKTFNYYTLIVPILAKQLVSSGWSLETLKEKVKQGLRAFEDTEKVAVAKDGRIHRKTALDMMRATFRIVGLSDIQRRVLTNLYFLRFVKMNKAEYRKYFWKESEKRAGHIDAINDLLYLGWIKKKHGWENAADVELEIHPVIVEMIEIELKPDVTTSDIAEYIQHYMPWSDSKEHLFEGIDDWGLLHQDTVANKLKWFCSFANNLDFSNADNLTYVVRNLFKLINGNIFVMELIEDWRINKLLEKIEFYSNNCSADIGFMFEDIRLVFESKKMISFFGPKDAEVMRKEAQDKTYLSFFKAYNQIKNVSEDLKDCAIITLCKPLLQLVEQYRRRISRDIYKVIEAYEDIWYDEFGDSIWHYSELEEGDFLEDFDSDTVNKHTVEENAEAHILDKESDGEGYYIHKYEWGCDIEELVDELKADTRFTNSEKASIFEDMTDSVMRRIENFRSYQDSDECFAHNKYLNETNWDRLRQISKYYLSFMHNNEFDECCDVDWEMATAERCMAIAEAMMCDTNLLSKKLSIVVENTLSNIDSIEANNALEWKAWTQFYDVTQLGYSREAFGFYDGMHGTGYYANICRNLRHCHLIIPSLLKLLKKTEEKIQQCYNNIQDLISTKWYPFSYEDTLEYDVGESKDPQGLLYNWYRTIAEFALNSSIEKGITTPEGMKYFDLHTEYYKKACSLIESDSGANTVDIQFFHCYCQYETISDLCVEYYVQCYMNGMDVELLNEKIHNEQRLSEHGILSIYEKIAHEIFFEVDRCWTVRGGYPAVMEYLKTNDWSRLEKLLKYQEDYYYDKDSFSNETDAYVINSRCDMYRAFLSAIRDDQNSFDEYMENLWENFIEDFEKATTYLHWSDFTEFDDIGRITHGWDLTRTFAGLNDIERQQFALPYLIKCAEHIHTWLKTLPNYSELMMYSWYKVIAEFALEADDDDGAYVKYQDKVDEMAEKHYEIKLDDLD